MDRRKSNLIVKSVLVLALFAAAIGTTRSAIAETDGSQDASRISEVLNGVTIYLPVIMKNYDSTEPTDWDVIMTENFEGTFPSGLWVVEDNSVSGSWYTWGKRDCRGYTSSNSAWAVGAGPTILTCNVNYPENVNTRMKYGPFSLADASQAELVYRKWLNINQEGNDGFRVSASTDGTTWYGPNLINGSSGGWGSSPDVFDLTAVPTLGDLTGQSQVWIAFEFVSDGDGNVLAHGAYIDDVLLQKCDGSCTPTSTSIIGLDAEEKSDAIK